MGKTLEPFIQLAYDWHGGMSSPLYQFASNHGVISDLNHAETLCYEVIAILENPSFIEDPEDKIQLELFLVELQKYKQEVENGTIIKSSN